MPTYRSPFSSRPREILAEKPGEETYVSLISDHSGSSNPVILSCHHKDHVGIRGCAEMLLWRKDCRATFLLLIRDETNAKPQSKADLIASFLGTFLGPHAFAIMGLCNIDETRANRGEM